MFIRFLFRSLGGNCRLVLTKMPPSVKSSLLGVQFDLSGARGGYFEVGSPEGRKTELDSRISGIIVEANHYSS